MARRNIERQIRYNMKTDTGEQVRCRHNWIFFIVNDLREISRIRQRILEQLAPIDSESFQELAETQIPSSWGIHYEFLIFSSDKGEIPDYRKIYDSGRFKKDRDLLEVMEKGEADMHGYASRVLRI